MSLTVFVETSTWVMHSRHVFYSQQSNNGLNSTEKKWSIGEYSAITLPHGAVFFNKLRYLSNCRFRQYTW